MYYRFIIPILIWSTTFAYAQFKGGDADGFNSTNLIGSKITGKIASFKVLFTSNQGNGFHSLNKQITLSHINFNIYKGGSNHGFDSNNTLAALNNTNITVIYKGFIGDGYTSKNSQLNLKNANIAVLYIGNQGDGYNHNTITTILNGSDASIYHGGIGDGFNYNINLNNYLTGSIIAIYHGGNGDGFTYNNLTSALVLKTHNLLNDNNVQLYPNPANQELHIQTRGFIRLTKVEVYDISAKKLKVSVDNNTINTSQLSEGYYLIKLYSKKNNVNKRILIQH
ncbi:hypothetical protein PK35_16345 [Tamlana nanhaiensis]|uniref:Secretion system C-terminal sorting domain-containing protein n=1 Tax=Neotamlana nanhaiensis TaxID=1382798 RepID=A0A0D7VWA2_9FLAO|nr:T9SS type A sorting domain-containing protein [Tamlana nanhaiensis]KJD31126.1 hypothetical protein PK35_16345 [Tamlana nanhaiensis]